MSDGKLVGLKTKLIKACMPLTGTQYKPLNDISTVDDHISYLCEIRNERGQFGQRSLNQTDNTHIGAGQTSC